MNESTTASEDFIRRVEAARNSGAKSLSLLGGFWGALTYFPDSLSSLVGLETLILSHPVIEDFGNIAEMKSLSKLVLHSAKLRDLSKLEYVDGLIELNLSGSSLVDPSSIAKLRQIKKFSWHGGDLRDSCPLKGLSNLTELRLRAARIDDLDGGRELKNLRYLDLSLTEIADLSPLSELEKLEILDLTGTKVSDLTPLAGLTRLKVLGLSRTQVEDLSPLSGLVDLRQLHLNNSPVHDLSGLESLSKLATLSLNSTEIEEVSKLSGLSNLMTLRMEDTKLRSLSGISSAVRMRRLFLANSSVVDISAVSEQRYLEKLDLSNTPTSDASPLQNLKNLEALDLSHSQVVDIRPLAALRQLRSLNLNGTPVLDLRPIKGLRRLTTFSKEGGLQFEGTRAATTDPEIARISANPKERARAKALAARLESWTPPPENEESSQVEKEVSSATDFAFLSYSSKDRDFIGSFYHFLREQSVPIWWDRDIEAGASWREEIARRLAEARTVVTFWTSESVRSKSVIEEASKAQESGKLIHVRLDGSSLPYGFAETQYIDLRQWDGTAEHSQMRKLLQSIQDKLNPPSSEAIAERLLASSPIAMVAERGKLTPKDTPPNARPETENAIDLGERLIGLKQTVQAAIIKVNDTSSYQTPNDLRYSLTAIEDAISGEKITWYGLEDAEASLAECMDVHHAQDAWNAVLVGDLTRVRRRILELRPLLQPRQIPIGLKGSKPPELDPTIGIEQLPEVLGIVSNFEALLASQDGLAVFDEAAQKLASREIYEFRSSQDEFGNERKLARSRRSFRWMTYIVGSGIAALSTPVIVNLLTAPQAAATLISRMKSIYEMLLKFFS